MIRRLLIAAGALGLLIAPAAASAPTLSGMTGTFSEGQHVSITGSNFDTKVPAAPYFWSAFDSSIAGSTFGVVGAFSAVQDLIWANEGFSGGCLKAGSQSGVWTAALDKSSPSWTDESSTFVVIKREKMNFAVTSTTGQNWKIWRMWSQATGKPNAYAASNNGRAFVEYIGIESGFWASFNVGDTAWHHLRWLFKASSAINVKDGSLELDVDGVENSKGTLLTRSSTAPGYMDRNYVVHGVQANKSIWSPAWDTANRLWVDDLYVDTTFQRIEVCDNATFANCRKFGQVIPESWTNVSAGGVMHLPGFVPGEHAYLHVFNKAGQGPTLGMLFTVAGSVVGTPPPTLTSINHPTGSVLGGTSETGTGTGFIAPMTVTVAGLSATSVVRVSPTQMTFVTPAGPANSTGDVVACNADGQCATLGNGFTWGPPIDPPVDVDPLSQRKAFPAYR